MYIFSIKVTAHRTRTSSSNNAISRRPARQNRQNVPHLSIFLRTRIRTRVPSDNWYPSAVFRLRLRNVSSLLQTIRRSAQPSCNENNNNVRGEFAMPKQRRIILVVALAYCVFYVIPPVVSCVYHFHLSTCRVTYGYSDKLFAGGECLYCCTTL